MEIIRRGTPPHEKTYRTTCKTCDTYFSFSILESNSGWDRDGVYRKCDCPVCHSPVYTLDIPYSGKETK